MDFIWQETRFFKEPFISIANWDFSTLKNFPKEKYLSADTETQLFYVGEPLSFEIEGKTYNYEYNQLLSEEHASMLYKKMKSKFCRTNIEVRPYAFMLSNGADFVLFQNAEDFLTACSMFQVERVFWYNAKFDFSIFDYYMLTNGWVNSDDRVQDEKSKKHHGKLPDKTYQCLNGDFGQRYQMKIWKSCLNQNSKLVVRSFSMVDICNIFGGGLKRNLEDWKITDFDGNDVRKLEMDYVNVDMARDLPYMINDTKGLHLLTLKIDETIKELCNLSILKGDYITAGGLAKKVLLRHLFRSTNDKENKALLKHYFPISIEEDKEARDLHLYQGGKCFVNPYYVNKEMHDVYKYDVNSMYPNQMRNMTYPVGEYTKLDKLPKKLRKDKIYILNISNIYGTLKEDMIPVWYDTLTGDYVPVINEVEERLIWLEELEEYKKWYVFSRIKINYVLEFSAFLSIGSRSYVDLFYDIKKNSKGAIRNGAKLFLNSAYGKWAQRVEMQKCEYVLGEDGYVQLKKGEIEIDENNMMNVYVGSRISALSRVHLMYYMRVICKGNVKQNFVYCDTDSVHALTPYNKCDDKELGKMKCEGVYKTAKYLAPKTYLMYDGEDYEVHTKGVNTQIVYKDLCDKTEKMAFKSFKSGKKYRCLTALNVKGGKALIMVEKYIARDDNVKEFKDDEILYNDYVIE